MARDDEVAFDARAGDGIDFESDVTADNPLRANRPPAGPQVGNDVVDDID